MRWEASLECDGVPVASS